MKGRTVGVILATLVASVGLAPAARATDAPPWPLSCMEDSPTPPTLGTVSIDSTGLHVNLDAPPADADAVRQHAVDLALYWAACLTSRLPMDDVSCFAEIATNITRYVNVNPPQIDVYYPALARDVALCALSG